MSTPERFKQPNPERTVQIRDYCRYVYSLLYGETGILARTRDSISNLIPNFRPIDGINDPIERLLYLNRTVPELAATAIGHPFKKCIYIGSGTDILAAANYASNVVTADINDIFYIEQRTEDQDRKILAGLLEEKAVQGFYYTSVYNNDRGLLAYALDLYLLGVNLESLEVVDEEVVDGAKITTVQFTLPNGRKVTHKHIPVYGEGMGVPGTGFSSTEPLHQYIISELQSGEDMILLSKAGVNYPFATVLPYVPDGTCIVDDMSPLSWKDIKIDRSIRLIDIKEQIRTRLEELQDGEPRIVPNRTRDYYDCLGYGYANDLRLLNFFNVRRFK